jgi:hypothetical protein
MGWKLGIAAIAVISASGFVVFMTSPEVSTATRISLTLVPLVLGTITGWLTK